jgi:hypothetical protein
MQNFSCRLHCSATALSCLLKWYKRVSLQDSGTDIHEVRLWSTAQLLVFLQAGSHKVQVLTSSM